MYCPPDSQTRFFKTRPVPLAIQEKVSNELDRLLKDKVIVPVTNSDWASPIVPIQKKDGSVRICGDYKLTNNKTARLEVYPLPRIDELFASLVGETFPKLDLSHAYQQVPLEEGSQQYVMVNTHWGPFRYKRLPFGVPQPCNFSYDNGVPDARYP